MEYQKSYKLTIKHNTYPENIKENENFTMSHQVHLQRNQVNEKAV